MADERVNIINRKARYEYEILDTYEAGIVLEGSEVKSVRAGKVSLAEAYCRFIGNELFLVDCHITPYAQAGTHSALSPTRSRKLLLKKTELRRLHGKVTTKGLTIVPLRIYASERLMKVEIALARGKKTADKRKTIRDRDLQRESRGLKGKLRV
jgi:SsrA-binding protein